VANAKLVEVTKLHEADVAHAAHQAKLLKTEKDQHAKETEDHHVKEADLKHKIMSKHSVAVKD